jgi:hypothetical protein
MEDEEEGHSPPGDTNKSGTGEGNGGLTNIAPMPALARQSLDGETIFAVGEDGDKWSDDEDDSPRVSHERKNLAK